MNNRAPGTDVALLIARILMAILFLYAGYAKLTGVSGTVQEFASNGIPFPTLATLIAVIAEVPFILLIVAGAYTRPLAVLLALYTTGTAVLGHPYWAVPADQHMNMLLHFYKNIAITGGFLALYAAGAGRLSIDGLRSKR